MAVVVAVCSPGSPTVAAAIASVASWHWLFLINVPIGALALMFGGADPAVTPRAPPGAWMPLSVLLNALQVRLVTAGVKRITTADALGFGADRDRCRYRGRRRRAGVRRSSSCLRRCCRSIFCAVRCFALSLATSIASFGAQALAIVSLPFTLKTGSATGVDLRTAAVALAARDRLDRAHRRAPGRPDHPGPPWRRRIFGDERRIGSRRPWASAIPLRSRSPGASRSAASASGSSSRPTIGSSSAARHASKAGGCRPAILRTADRPVARHGAGGGRTRTGACTRDGNRALGRCRALTLTGAITSGLRKAN